MEFRPSKRIKVVETSTEYPHVLQLFLKPPNGEISLEEFEAFAFDRVKLLRVFERATLMGHKLYSQEWKTVITGYLKKESLRKYANLIQSTGSNTESDADLAVRREDHISHFILRLCYCRAADDRAWFVQREIELFKLRFSNLSAAGVKNFIKSNGLSYTPISEEAKNEIKEGLVQSTFNCNHADVENKDFYKVPFWEVADLISKRMVYVKAGFAYIPSSELVSCLMSLYRTNLNKELLMSLRKLPFIDDERVTSLINCVHNSYNGKDYTNPEKKDKIDADDLQRLSMQSFPMCMRSMYDTIIQTHHMRHFGRLQFGLFLKGIGLSLEEAIRFWKGEFTKAIDEDKFTKQYLYNIKHSYGCIGNMRNYSPYSCMKIISSTVGPGDCHGCPFKHWEEESLRKKMCEYGVNGDGIRDVLETVKEGHYQIACSKYFIHTHGGIESKSLIGHPNQYFEDSQEIRKNSQDKFTKRNVKNKPKQFKCEYCESNTCTCAANNGKKEKPNDVTYLDDYTFSAFSEDFDAGETISCTSESVATTTQDTQE